jgi:hypothetical protein
LLVDCPIQILPGPVDLETCLIDPPSDTDGAFMLSKGFFQQWQKPDRPAVGRRMVNHYAVFLHYFFEVPIA